MLLFNNFKAFIVYVYKILCIQIQQFSYIIFINCNRIYLNEYLQKLNKFKSKIYLMFILSNIIHFKMLENWKQYMDENAHLELIKFVQASIDCLVLKDQFLVIYGNCNIDKSNLINEIVNLVGKHNVLQFNFNGSYNFPNPKNLENKKVLLIKNNNISQFDSDKHKLSSYIKNVICVERQIHKKIYGNEIFYSSNVIVETSSLDGLNGGSYRRAKIIHLKQI